MNTNPNDNHSTGKTNRERVNEIRNRKILILSITVIVCLFLAVGVIYQAMPQRTDVSTAQQVITTTEKDSHMESQQSNELQGSMSRSDITQIPQVPTQAPTKEPTKAPTRIPPQASTVKPSNETGGSKPSEILYDMLSVNINGNTLRASVIRSISPDAVRDIQHRLYVGGKLVAAVPEMEGFSYYSGYGENDNRRCFSNSIYDTSYEVWDVLLYSYDRLESEYGISWNRAIVTNSPIWEGKKVLISCNYNIPSFEWDETTVTDWHDDLESNGYGKQLSDVIQFTLPSGWVVRGFIHNQGYDLENNLFIRQEVNLEMKDSTGSRILSNIDLWIPDEEGTAEFIPDDKLWRIILPYMPVPVGY